MADEQQPAVPPPAAAQPKPLPQENPNPPPEQLEVFLYFLVLLFPRFCFSPILARALVFLYFILARTRFYLDLPSYLLAWYFMSFTFVFCLVVCASCWLH